ncbi:MAG: peptide chain release factor N(5)-glutamine methyltransferase [Chloroflexi bacterium]|nr:peptide chain release factor N(5)-glutamine methyltransferase [Chloroflexota bacterium]
MKAEHRAPGQGSDPARRVKQACRQAVVQLQAAHIDSPQLDAELLLAHCLQVERPALLAHPEWPLEPGQLAHFRRLLARRVHHEPLAYLIGERWFYGLLFYINSDVLVPRPETEMLVEAGLAWLRQRPQLTATVVDVGTGSGAIAVAMAVHAPPSARIIGSDLSAAALAVARRNAGGHGVAARVQWMQGDLLSGLAEPVQLILANLPYVATADREGLMPEVRDHEPKLALFAGPTGLDMIARCLQQARSRLTAGGAMFLEIGYQQGPAVRDLAQRAFPTATVTVHPDLAGLDRMVRIQTASPPHHHEH